MWFRSGTEEREYDYRVKEDDKGFSEIFAMVLQCLQNNLLS
jgi:hypothetical protein